jgi:hypothetical protein
MKCEQEEGVCWQGAVLKSNTMDRTWWCSLPLEQEMLQNSFLVKFEVFAPATDLLK